MKIRTVRFGWKADDPDIPSKKAMRLTSLQRPTPVVPLASRRSYSPHHNGEACTNNAESFFSRMRRAEIGTHHSIAGPYLSAYASEMAWREDHRRKSNGAQYVCLGLSCATWRS